MKVAVVGAGAGGLAAAKALLECDIDPVVFEASADLGGLWVYDDAQDSGGPTYRSLRTNTSKEITAFSDLPMDATITYFPHRSAVETYLRLYANRFDLAPRIHFSSQVEAVRPLPEDGWQLTVRSGDAARDEVFDAVLIATGIFRRPAMPMIPGADSYRGDLRHSITYRTPDRFRGQRVVVVGLGSSAVDIAAELTDVATGTTLSTRRGAWVNPRLIDGRPIDHRRSRLEGALPSPLQTRRRRRLIGREYARRGLLPIEDLWARANIPFQPSTAPSVTSDEIPPLILGGMLGIRAGIARLTEDGIECVDGSRVPADTVILCTGYTLDFPFLPTELQPWNGSDAGLYRLVFPPHHPTLAFIGVCRVQGPVLPIVEMQSRWAARVIAGDVFLPDHATMYAEIAERRRVQHANSDSLIRVRLLPYLDQIADEIGVRPHVWRHLELARPLLTGPPAAAQYRLDGPDQWSGAADHLRRVGD